MLIPLKRFEQTITVAIRTKTGVDNLNCPIYSWEEHIVEGCLCVPQEPTDLPTGKWTDVRQEGHQAKYYCYIPAKCTLNFENARVKVDGHWFKTIGIPQPYVKHPTRFNQYVILQRETG